MLTIDLPDAPDGYSTSTVYKDDRINIGFGREHSGTSNVATASIDSGALEIYFVGGQSFYDDLKKILQKHAIRTDPKWNYYIPKPRGHHHIYNFLLKKIPHGEWSKLVDQAWDNGKKEGRSEIQSQFKQLVGMEN